MRTFHFICPLVLALAAAVSLSSCEKPGEPLAEKDGAIQEVKAVEAPIAEEPVAATEDVKATPGSTALPPFDQLSLEAQAGLGDYYTAENISEAGDVIEALAAEARGRIVEALRDGKKIEAVKVVRERGGIGLAVCKIAVEMISIKEGIHPGL
ncbi:hypothetical protein VSU19_02885 [Verrucomicrobiales bacterium BCK34]|nr:hypothetical protein [Verrucomicrobiales bacterium BCK34]